MKVTLDWLKQHIDTDASLDTIVETLTRIGLEVEGVENPGATLAAFRVAKVLNAAPHPQADKLQVLSVDAGDGPLQVVCGAPNARAGLVGVFGAPGATVPSNGMVLKVAAIRGVESNGMMCSTRELELGEEHDGIIELPADAPIGMAYPDYAGLNDPVIEVNVLPNRPDCMGVRGIALDLVAAGSGRGRRPRRADRRYRRLSGFLRAGRHRPRQWHRARMDAPPPDRDRPAVDLDAGRHYQLRDVRSGASAACL
jgi:phenylalanyl-tRNA synthetase beta chain